MEAQDIGGILQVIGIVTVLYFIVKLVGLFFGVKMPWIKDKEPVRTNDPHELIKTKEPVHTNDPHELIKTKGLLLEELEFSNFNTEKKQWITMNRGYPLPEHNKLGTSLYVIFQLGPNTIGFLALFTLISCRQVELTNDDFIKIYLEYLKRESAEFSLVASLQNSKKIEVLETRYREYSNDNNDTGASAYKKFQVMRDIHAAQHSFWSKQ